MGSMIKPLIIFQMAPPHHRKERGSDLSSAVEALRVGAGLSAWHQIELVLVFEEPVARLLFPIQELDLNEADVALNHYGLLRESKATLHTLSDRPVPAGWPTALSRKKFAALLARADHFMRF